MEILKIKVKIFIFSLMALKLFRKKRYPRYYLELLSADFHILALKPGTPRT